MPRVVALTGFGGVGKSTAVKYLLTRGFSRVIYLGGFVIEELDRQGFPGTPEALRSFQRALRASLGPAATIILATDAISDAMSREEDFLIDGINSLEEYTRVVTICNGAALALLAIEATFVVRCARLSNRPQWPLNPDQIESRDAFEVEVGKNKVIELAHELISNNEGVGPLYHALDRFLLRTA